MQQNKGLVMSGIRPTGNLHLGNYFGAMRNYVRMQEEYQCYFMVADLHSLTTHPDTSSLKVNVAQHRRRPWRLYAPPSRLYFAQMARDAAFVR